MISIFRAAGKAAAALTIAVGAIHAGPSYAWQAPAPAAPLAVEHHAAAVEAGDLSLNPLPSEAAQPTAAPTVAAAQPSQGEAAPQLPAIGAPKQEIGSARVRPLAELVSAYGSADTLDAEHECLAGAVYFEAKGESLRGQLTVAEVVINRSRSGRFPSSICGVVKQRGQFSFIRAGRFPPIARGTLAWRRAVAIAHVALEDMADGAAPRAMFFHATHVSPRWRGLTRIATVGNHVFYR